MRTLMIHEVDRKTLSFLQKEVRETDVLTFDDGLYSQFRYWTFLRDVFKNNRKIFFISTEAVRDCPPRIANLNCELVMDLWLKENDKSGYMSWKEINIINNDGGEIGSHGHGHYYSFGETAQEQVENFKTDISIMEKSFRENLGFVPSSYARPYNKKQIVERPILGDKTEIFGKERVDIRELMGEPGYGSEYREFKRA